MNIHNHTKFQPQNIIEHETLLKRVRNLWRQRDIELYQHPEKNDSVISIGITFDKSMMVMVEESKEDWKRELNSPNEVAIIQ